jgi:hypothetical protein
MSNTSVVCGAQGLTVDDVAACFRDRLRHSVATSLERERTAQPVRVATRASSIPFTSLRPNPHKLWADTSLVTCWRSLGQRLILTFVADSRQSVAKYQQPERSDSLASSQFSDDVVTVETTRLSFLGLRSCPSVPQRTCRPTWLILTLSWRTSIPLRTDRFDSGTADAEGHPE